MCNALSPSLLPSRALLDMAIVEEGPNLEAEVKAREDTVYRIQLRLLEIQLRLLDEEERKLKLQERFAVGDDLAGIQRRLECIPSKMSKLRLKMVCVCVRVHVCVSVRVHVCVCGRVYMCMWPWVQYVCVCMYVAPVKFMAITGSLTASGCVTPRIIDR